MDPAGSQAAHPRLRARLLAVLLTLVLIAGFAWALSGQWSEVVTSLGQQRIDVLAGALVLALVGVLMSFVLWRGVLGALGSHVPLATAARIFFVAQLGKYLPGSLWPVVVQMRLGKEAGIPRQRMGLAFVLTLGLSVAWGLLLGLLSLPALVAAGEDREVEAAWLLPLVVLVPAVVVLMLPRPLNALLGLGLRVLRRPGLDQPLTARQITAASLWTLAFWLVFASHVWLLAIGLGADALSALPVAIGGFALAFSIGPLLVVLPAGAGVREAALVVLLLPVLDTPEATAVALTSRALLLVTDGLLAASATVLRRPRRKVHDREASATS